MSLATKDGTPVIAQNDEELFYSLANDLFELVNIPPIVVGGTWNDAVLRMQQVLIAVTLLKDQQK